MEATVLAAVVTAVAAAIPALVAVVRNYLGGRRLQRGASVKITIDGETLELSNVGPEQQRELIEKFLQQLNGDAPDGPA